MRKDIVMAARSPLHEPAHTAGAVFVEESGFLIPAHFGDVRTEYDAARTAAVLVDQSSHGKIEVWGADAARFLHNLTTNDILSLTPGAGCEAFLTTAKAKVIAYLLIYHYASPPGFSLDVAPGAADKVIRHLDRYLISEQVEFANPTATFAQMHLAGPRAAALLEQVLGEGGRLPAEPLHHAPVRFDDSDESWIRRHDALGLAGYDIVCSATQAADIWQRLLQAGARPAGREVCEMLRIEAGLPREGADIDENTFAPEVGRIAQTISYTKGCYLGQESIVMARDRGQVNRTLVGVQLPDGPASHGSLLFAGDKEVGRITSSVHSPRLNMGLALAYVRRGHQEPGTKLEVEIAGKRSLAEVIQLPIE
jgi:folate-binding protein YgfZ